MHWTRASLPGQRSIERRRVPQVTDQQMGRNKTRLQPVRRYTPEEIAAYEAANPVPPVPMKRRSACTGVADVSRLLSSNRLSDADVNAGDRCGGQA
jgi:hypothetical protein